MTGIQALMLYNELFQMTDQVGSAEARFQESPSIILPSL